MGREGEREREGKGLDEMEWEMEGDGKGDGIVGKNERGGVGTGNLMGWDGMG